MKANLVIDKQIRSKYHEGFKRAFPIREIVIHGTGGGANVAALLKWMMGGERREEYGKGIALFHYVIDYNGDIYNIINPERWVFHSSCGQHDQVTIGIELMNPDPQNRKPYTDQQYESLFHLIFELMTKYGEIDSITSHSMNGKKYSNFYKPCPGNFKWDRLKNAMKNHGYEFKYDDEHFYKVDIT